MRMLKSFRNKFFPDRQLYFRKNGDVRFISLTSNVQITFFLFVFLTFSLVTMLSLSYFVKSPATTLQKEYNSVLIKYEQAVSELEYFRASHGNTPPNSSSPTSLEISKVLSENTILREELAGVKEKIRLLTKQEDASDDFFIRFSIWGRNYVRKVYFALEQNPDYDESFYSDRFFNIFFTLLYTGIVGPIGALFTFLIYRKIIKIGKPTTNLPSAIKSLIKKDR